MSEFIGGVVNAGGVPETRVGTLKSFTWVDRGVEYRLDLDNLRGHNLRQ
jgi:hypothetical protein